MIILETSFLVDYLAGVEATRSFLEENRDKPLFAPTLSLLEVYRGATRQVGQSGLDRLDNSLDWITFLPLTTGTAREAAVIETELLEEGEPINLGDVLIAGISRHHGGHLVTRDDHFERVSGLQTMSY